MAVPSVKPQITPDPRSLTILGSTGSIGCNTIDLIERHPDDYRVVALTAYNSYEILAEQARRLMPELVVIGDEHHYRELKSVLSGTGIEVAAGPQALIEAAMRPAEWVMAAIVGAAGLAPTLAAIQRGAMIALANKETLVCAGALMMAEVARYGATLLPVDSEHNAIFQVLEQDRAETIERIILTASGGPFREWSLAEMAAATPEQAVAHPNWQMGAKISVDSATMMNKGLEMIEAHYLFAMPGPQIDVLVHPQSVVHSMVAYRDGSVLAQMGQPDMRTPIAYTLAWPTRMAVSVERLDLAAIGQLSFEAPDPVRFPTLRIAREALGVGNGAPTVLNAANEVAVEGFLARKLGFLDIARVVEGTLEAMPVRPAGTIEDVWELDREARRLAAGLAGLAGRK
ncbi:MAG TPA: 1-deoxy-D-xylulose-5-phosphate reductoisomerase [Kiloniellales bacterium]